MIGAALTTRLEGDGHLFGLSYLPVLFLGVVTVPGSSLLINPLRRDRMVQRATDRDTD